MSSPLRYESPPVIHMLWITGQFCGQSPAVAPHVIPSHFCPGPWLQRAWGNSPSPGALFGSKRLLAVPRHWYEEKGELRKPVRVIGPVGMWMSTCQRCSSRGWLSRSAWGRDPSLSPGSCRRRRLAELSPAVNIPSPSHPQPLEHSSAGPGRVVGLAVSVMQKAATGGYRGGRSRRRARATASALTPGFRGPYHRVFGAVSAPNLCLPSTTTGLRESSS